MLVHREALLGHELDGEAVVQLFSAGRSSPSTSGRIDSPGDNASWEPTSSGEDGRTSYPGVTPIQVDEDVLDTVASCTNREEAPFGLSSEPLGFGLALGLELEFESRLSSWDRALFSGIIPEMAPAFVVAVLVITVPIPEDSLGFGEGDLESCVKVLGSCKPAKLGDVAAGAAEGDGEDVPFSRDRELVNTNDNGAALSDCGVP